MTEPAGETSVAKPRVLNESPVDSQTPRCPSPQTRLPSPTSKIKAPALYIIRQRRYICYSSVGHDELRKIPQAVCIAPQVCISSVKDGIPSTRSVVYLRFFFNFALCILHFAFKKSTRRNGCLWVYKCIGKYPKLVFRDSRLVLLPEAIATYCEFGRKRGEYPKTILPTIPRGLPCSYIPLPCLPPRRRE